MNGTRVSLLLGTSIFFLIYGNCYGTVFFSFPLPSSLIAMLLSLPPDAVAASSYQYVMPPLPLPFPCLSSPPAPTRFSHSLSFLTSSLRSMSVRTGMYWHMVSPTIRVPYWSEQMLLLVLD